MGQEQSSPRKQSHRQYHLSTVDNQKNSSKPTIIEYEGILLLRGVPFKNCIQIETESTPLFLENVEVNLGELLSNRMYTNRLFPVQDVEKLVQNVSYTLAFLQEHGVAYKDICAENIFYDEGNFKLLPNQIITQDTLQKFKKFVEMNQCNERNQFVPLSPEIIIAYRCQEELIKDFQILNKSNVFHFGMVLLQVVTLLPSSECYDPNNYDILDDIVTKRLELVQEYYNRKLLKIIANMLDYDYSERMNPKELSIWINRQMNDKIRQGSIKYGLKQGQIEPQCGRKETIVQSDSNSQKIQQQFNKKKIQQSRPRRKNTVYMEDQNSQQKLIDKNKVYLAENCQYDHLQKNKPKLMSYQNHKYIFHQNRSNYAQENNKSKLNQNCLYDRQYPEDTQREKNPRYCYQKQNFPIDDFKLTKQRCQEAYQQKPIRQYQQSYQYKNKDSSLNLGQQNSQASYTYAPKNPYLERQESSSQEKMSLRLKQTNQFYPTVNQLIQQKDRNLREKEINAPKRKLNYQFSLDSSNIRQQNSATSKIDENDYSISKVKEQIDKARKLINRFKQNQRNDIKNNEY